MNKKNSLIVNHLMAMPSSINNYKYYINNNLQQSHSTTPEKLFTLISSFFSDPQKILICEEIIKNRQAFEISVEDKKIYKLKTNKNVERKKEKIKNLSHYYTPDSWQKEILQKKS